MKMPEPRVVVNLLPHIADARNRRFKKSKLVNLVRILRRVSVGDHQADVVTDQINALIAEALDEFVNVSGSRLLVVDRRGPRRVAEAAQVWGDDGVVSAEFFKERNPHPRSVAKAVEQYERRLARPGFEVMNL